MRGPKLYLNVDDRAALLTLRAARNRRLVAIPRDTFTRLALEHCGLIQSETDSRLDVNEFHDVLIELHRTTRQPARMARSTFERMMQDHERMRARVTPR